MNRKPIKTITTKQAQAVHARKEAMRPGIDKEWAEHIERVAQVNPGHTPELLETLANIAELQLSNDYPHVKAEMTRRMALKAIAKATEPLDDGDKYEEGV